MIYTGKNPKNIQAVITEAAHVFVEDETIKGVEEAIEPFRQGKFDGLSKYHGERYQEVFFAWNDTWLDSRFKNWDITEYLPEITAPILIIQGQDDQYGTLEQVRTIERLTGGKSTVFTPEGVGHSPHKAIPLQIINAVESFLNEI